MIVSAVVRPRALWMSQSARDQIWPSWWIRPVWSSIVRFVSTRRRQCGTSAVYEIESQSAMHVTP
jgi:hypothetical protein